MVHWREEYFAALAVRDESEKANISLYDAYTRLANRTSRTATTTIPSGPQPDVVAGEKKQRKLSNEPAASITDILTATRADLSEAQRSRSELQGRLDRVTADLGKLQKRSAQDQRRISALESERTNLRLRLRDRDEELRGKAKLLDVWTGYRHAFRKVVIVNVLIDFRLLFCRSRISKMNLQR